MKTKTMKIMNLVAFAVMVLVNVLANVIPLGGNTSGQVSDMYPSLFTPADVTFSIWGIIYIVLAVTLICSLVDHSYENDMLVVLVGLLFVISCVLNVVWIFAWHYDWIVLSTILIFALLAVVLLMMFRVRENVLASAAFGLYAGWLTVASIAAVFVMVISFGHNGYGAMAVVLTGLAMALGAGIIITVVMLSDNVAYALAAIWAYVGIIIKQVTTHDAIHPVLVGIAVISILAIGASAGVTRGMKYGKKETVIEK